MMDDRAQRAGKPAERGKRKFARYDRDLYSWALEQAALLRAGRVAEADVLNIAEEIDDLGSEEYKSLQRIARDPASPPQVALRRV